MFVAPERTRRKKKIEVRHPGERQGLAVEDEPGFEQGEVEPLAVVRDHRPEIHAGQKSSEIADHGGLGREVFEKELEDVEFLFAVEPDTDEEGNGACAAGEAGRLEVEEQGRVQVAIEEALVAAEE